MHLNFITAPVHCRFQWPIILFNVLSSATKDCSTFFLTLLTRGLLTFSFSRLVKVIKFQSCPSLRQHLHLMHSRTKLDFVWLPKGLIVPLQLISRYFFLRSKSSKESLRVSKFDSLVDKLSKQVTVKVNNWIVAEVRKCLKKALWYHWTWRV